MGVCESIAFFLHRFQRKQKPVIIDYAKGFDVARELINDSKMMHRKQITFPVMCSQCDVIEMCVSKWYFPMYIVILYESGGGAIFIKQKSTRTDSHNNPHYAKPLFFSSVTDLNDHLTWLKENEVGPFSHRHTSIPMC